MSSGCSCLTKLREFADWLQGEIAAKTAGMTATQKARNHETKELGLMELGCRRALQFIREQQTGLSLDEERTLFEEAYWNHTLAIFHQYADVMPPRDYVFRRDGVGRYVHFDGMEEAWHGWQLARRGGVNG